MVILLFIWGLDREPVSSLWKSHPLQERKDGACVIDGLLESNNVTERLCPTRAPAPAPSGLGH
jgi:hypothetical protein